MKRERLIKIIGILIIIFIVINFVPTKYTVMRPGVAEKLSSIITVENGYKDSIKGSFMLTAVESKRASVWDYIYISLVKPAGQELEALREQLPPGMDMEKYISIMAELMEESKLKAQAVAIKEAGYDVEVNGEGALVVEVLETGAAKGKLQQEDVIIEIDNIKVEFATDAVQLIRKHEIGEEVKIKVLRGEEELSYKLKTVEIENNPGKASIGVMITTKNLDYDFPVKVKFETKNIVGPSAGGMFTLEIYNQLIKHDITDGKDIAGTGTIGLEGEIGRIDGVTQKIMAAEKAGAVIFIVPEGNYETAQKVKTNIDLVPVKNFSDIISYLEKL